MGADAAPQRRLRCRPLGHHPELRYRMATGKQHGQTKMLCESEPTKPEGDPKCGRSQSQPTTLR
eukprot:15462640-Alexandrium_andersonii.AAC.1